MTRSTLAQLLLAALLAFRLGAAPADTPPTWERFETRYQSFLGAGSQALLPFPQLEPQAWAALEQRGLTRVYAQPGVYYTGKSWTFTLLRAEDGRYYLDAKGGFWGMDRLFYGPLAPSQLQPE